MDVLLFLKVVVPVSWVLFFVGLVLPQGARVVFWSYRAILIVLAGLFGLAFCYGAAMTVAGIVGAFERETNGFLFFFVIMYVALGYFAYALSIFGAALHVILVSWLLRGTYKLVGWVERLPQPETVAAAGRIGRFLRFLNRIV
jgi:hypothetical protein